MIQEAQATRETVVCGGDERERVVYISATHQVEIHVAKFTNVKKPSHFLLEYSGKSTGVHDTLPGLMLGIFHCIM